MTLEAALHRSSKNITCVNVGVVLSLTTIVIVTVALQALAGVNMKSVEFAVVVDIVVEG